MIFNRRWGSKETAIQSFYLLSHTLYHYTILYLFNMDWRPVYLKNSLLTCEKYLYQFCLSNLSLRAKSNKTDANIAHYFIDYRPKVIFSLKRMLLTFGYSLNNFVDNFTVNFVDSFKVNFKERFGEQFVDNFLMNFVDNTRDNFRDNLEDNICAQLFPVVGQSSGNCKTDCIRQSQHCKILLSIAQTKAKLF